MRRKALCQKPAVPPAICSSRWLRAVINILLYGRITVIQRRQRRSNLCRDRMRPIRIVYFQGKLAICQIIGIVLGDGNFLRRRIHDRHQILIPAQPLIPHPSLGLRSPCGVQLCPRHSWNLIPAGNINGIVCIRDRILHLRQHIRQIDHAIAVLHIARCTV